MQSLALWRFCGRVTRYAEVWFCHRGSTLVSWLCAKSLSLSFSLSLSLSLCVCLSLSLSLSLSLNQKSGGEKCILLARTLSLLCGLNTNDLYASYSLRHRPLHLHVSLTHTLLEVPIWQPSSYVFVFVLFVALKKRIPSKICVRSCFVWLKSVLFNFLSVFDLSVCCLYLLHLAPTCRGDSHHLGWVYDTG